MAKSKIQLFPIYKVLVNHEEVSCRIDEYFNIDRSSWVKTQTVLKGLGIFKSTKMDTGRVTVTTNTVGKNSSPFFFPVLIHYFNIPKPLVLKSS